MSDRSTSPIRTQSRPACPLCGGTGELLYDGLIDHLFGSPGTWSFRRCMAVDCRALWLDPAPVEADLPLLYRDYYTHGADLRREGSSFNPLRWLVRAACAWPWRRLGIYRDRREIGALFMGQLTPGRMLEVGCGSGRRLVVFQRLGWSVEGQELDPIAADKARAACPRATIHQGELSALSLPAAGYDLIAMAHVIEHAADPRRLLCECRRLLKPDGVCVVLTPNADSFGHLRFARHWRGLEPPRHRLIFSASNLGALAADAGFTRRRLASTCCHVEFFAYAGLDMSRGRRHDPVAIPSIKQEWSGKLMQLAAARAWRDVPLSGDELILFAKP